MLMGHQLIILCILLILGKTKYKKSNNFKTFVNFCGNNCILYIGPKDSANYNYQVNNQSDHLHQNLPLSH